MLNLGSTLARHYGLTNDCTVVIEKLSDCIRIWHPATFNLYYDNLANNGKRRK